VEGTSRSAQALGKRLAIVIPAYNEAGGIVETLLSIRKLLPDCEIVVVDDGSSDGTADAVRRFPDVRLVQHPYNRGYGAALKTGVRAARGDTVAWFDADAEHRVEDLVAMVERLERERLWAVVGQRRRPGGNAVRTLGKLLIRLLARSLGVRAGSDLNCGLRVFRREAILPYCALLPDGFSATMTSTIILLARRSPVQFHPIELAPRIGKSKVVIADGFGSILVVLRTIMLFAPMRIFFRAGMLLITLGLAYGVTLAVRHGLGLPVGSMLVMNAGMLLCMLGLIADQVSQLRLAHLERAESREAGAEPSDR
jgi:glycosyltransferase involved in cell wall biosynthesis